MQCCLLFLSVGVLMRIKELCQKCREIYEYAPCCSIQLSKENEKIIGAKFNDKQSVRISATGKVCVRCPYALPHSCSLGENRPQRCKDYPTLEDIKRGNITCPDCLVRIELEKEFLKTKRSYTAENWLNFLENWEEYE